MSSKGQLTNNLWVEFGLLHKNFLWNYCSENYVQIHYIACMAANV